MGEGVAGHTIMTGFRRAVVARSYDAVEMRILHWLFGAIVIVYSDFNV